MKKILSVLVGLLLIGGIAEASSSLDLPTSVRLVNPVGTATGTDSNPLVVVNSTEHPFTVNVVTTVSEVTALKAGTVNVVNVVDTKIVSGTLTGIANTVTVKLDSNIDTNLGKVKITNGTNEVNVNTDGSIDVNVLNQASGGTEKFGVYNVSVGAGATTEIGSYTVTAGKTLYVKNFIGTGKGDISFTIKMNGVEQAYFDTTAITPSFGMNLGDTFSVSAGTIVSVTATNNEAVTVNAKFNWNGTEK